MKLVPSLLAAAALIAGSFSVVAQAQSIDVALIDSAKASCIIGERNDGYLGVVDASKADDALRREVREVNQKRKAAYDDIARRNGVTVAVTAKLTAERLIKDARSGACVQNASGTWVKK